MGVEMATNYYLSWETGHNARRKLSRRTLTRLGIALGILLLPTLLGILIAVGNDVRNSGTNETIDTKNTPSAAGTAGTGGNNDGASNAFESTAVATHTAYAVVIPDFVPGASAAGVPDLSRLTWRFVTGCGTGLRLTALATFAIAVPLAYYLGRRSAAQGLR